MVIFLLVIIAAGIFIIAKAMSGTPAQRAETERRNMLEAEVHERQLEGMQIADRQRRTAANEELAKTKNVPGTKSDWS